jgi:hypothetical protein
LRTIAISSLLALTVDNRIVPAVEVHTVRPAPIAEKIAYDVDFTTIVLPAIRTPDVDGFQTKVNALGILPTTRESTSTELRVGESELVVVYIVAIAVGTESAVVTSVNCTAPAAGFTAKFPTQLTVCGPVPANVVPPTVRMRVLRLASTTALLIDPDPIGAPAVHEVRPAPASKKMDVSDVKVIVVPLNPGALVLHTRVSVPGWFPATRDVIETDVRVGAASDT